MPSLFEHPVLGRGFRPFFLLGAFYATLLVVFWVLQMRGNVFLSMPFYDPVLWHGHEMIFGFTMAIVSGFLLTAVANWTNGAPARQMHLAALCALWVAGRIVMNIEVDLIIAAAIDLAFIPALALTLALPLLRSWNKRNFIFLFILTALFLCNLSIFIWESRTGLYVAIIIIMMMISLVGGRIIPAFTVGALRRKGLERRITDQPRMDIAALVSLVLIACSIAVFGIANIVTSVLTFLSAGIHLWRMRVYHTRDVWGDPLLWSLHLGYMWLIAGLTLLGIASFAIVPLSPALHALTAGAIGTLTLSMMCRVALGHTGRELIAGSATTAAFILMQGAVLIRVGGPLLLPGYYMESIVLSGGLWAGAFVFYLFCYAPVLWQPRPDGRPA